jgi:hypothetical protein
MLQCYSLRWLTFDGVDKKSNIVLAQSVVFIKDATLVACWHTAADQTFHVRQKLQSACIKTVQYKQSRRPVWCNISPSLDVCDNTNCSSHMVMAATETQPVICLCCRLNRPQVCVLSHANNNDCSSGVLGLAGSTCPSSQLHMPEDLYIQFREFVWSDIFLEEGHFVVYQALRGNLS